MVTGGQNDSKPLKVVPVMEQTCALYQRKQNGPFLAYETALSWMWHASSTVWANLEFEFDICRLPQIRHLL